VNIVSFCNRSSDIFYHESFGVFYTFIRGCNSVIHWELYCRLSDCSPSNFVTFTGRVPNQTLFEVLSTADACDNPDRVNPMNDKSTMNKILEYMALGKPIVQFDVVEGRFSAQDASLYAKANDPIDFAQKIAGLLADPELRARMGAFGKSRVETEMAWAYEAPKLIKAYRHAGK